MLLSVKKTPADIMRKNIGLFIKKLTLYELWKNRYQSAA